MADNTRVNDIQDKLLQAMDIINAQALSSIAFDKTIVCIIEDDSYKKEGKYTVSDGTKIFTAFSQDTKLRKGENVYVTIPQGNFENQKIIIGKKTDDKVNKPFIFTTPFETLFDMTDNIVADTVQNGALTANALNKYSDNNTEYEYITLYDQSCDYYGFTRLGIKAKFKTWIKDAVRGNYGLAVILTVKTPNIASSKEVEEQEFYYNFLNKNMYGNTYNFETYYEQEMVIPLEEIQGTITNIKINFYQEANFFDKFNEPLICSENGYLTEEGTNIYIKDKDGDYVIAKNDKILEPNIFVNDVYLCFGYDISKFTSGMVEIYTQQSKTYKCSSDIENTGIEQNKKIIKVRWVHIGEDGPVDMVTLKEKETSLIPYEIRWYKYQVGALAADAYCGPYWTRIENANEFEYEFSPNINKQQEKIKVIIIYNSITPYRSNELIFENEEDLPPSEEAQHIANALTITADDGTNGNYFIYGQDNSIKDTEYAKEYRTLSVWFDANSNGQLEQNEIISDSLQSNNILWTVPADNTMLEFPDTNKKEIKQGEKIIAYQIYGYKLGYKISSYYSSNKTNNTVVCQYTLNDRVYTTEKEFSFGSTGTMGSDQTLVIDFVGDKNAIDIFDKTCQLQVQLYDNQNKLVTDLKGIEWSWFYNKSKQIEIDETTKYSNIVTLNFNNDDNYFIHGLYIIKVKIGTLETYFSLPIKREYSYISGPTTVIYQSNGEPFYNRDSYTLHPADNEYVSWRIRVDREYYKYTKVTITNEDIKKSDFTSGKYYKYDSDKEKYYWINPDSEQYDSKVVYYTKEEPQIKECYLNNKNEIELISSNSNGLIPAEIKDYIPEIKDKKLKPLSIYVEDAPVYGVQALIGDQVVWTQPILVTQNKWPSAVINNWDGKSLQMNEESGSIIAAAIAAGKKHSEDNTFSGVMIGDWSDKQLDTNAAVAGQTGLYGFHHGAMSYAFKEDGTAFIGKSSMARINFDGNESTIYSAGYKDTTTNPGGMMINLFNNGNPYISLKSPGNKNSNSYSEMKLDTKAGGSTIYMKKGNGQDITITNSGNIPLQVGSNFKVYWNGDIEANGGSIGNWNILSSGALQSNDKKITLNTASDGSIVIGNLNSGKITIDASGNGSIIMSNNSYLTGGTIYASTLSSNNGDDGTIYLDGYLEVLNSGNTSNTFLGYIQANTGDWWSDRFSNGVGFGYGKVSSPNAVVKATSKNVGLSFANGGWISIDANGIHFGTKNNLPSEQTGIYARFA